MLYGTPTARRRDAQRNRAAIVLAASEVLTERDPVALMPQIARRAGVGQATLYRHFPDRHALTAAVIEHQLGRLREAAAGPAGRPEQFRGLLRSVLHTQIAMGALVVLVRRLDAGTQDRFLRRALDALGGPLRRARDHGHVRADLVPDDLALLFTMVQGVAEATGDAARAVDLILDGICRPQVRTDPVDTS